MIRESPDSMSADDVRFDRRPRSTIAPWVRTAFVALTFVGSAAADSLLKNERPPVCPVDPTAGREYVRSILHPTPDDVEAARVAANGLRAEFAKLDVALMELLRRTPDEDLKEAIEREFVRAEAEWPNDQREKVAASVQSIVGSKKRNMAPVWIRAALGDHSAETLTRLSELCDSSFQAVRLSRLLLLRGDPLAALAVEERWTSKSLNWETRKKELSDAANSELGSLAWTRVAWNQRPIGLMYPSLGFDGAEIFREKLCWQVFDAAKHDDVRAAALTEIAAFIEMPTSQEEWTGSPIRILEAASRLSAASSNSAVRCAPIYRLALIFDRARDSAHADQRVAADLFEFVAFERSLEGAWGDAAVSAGSILRRLGEPKRAIAVLETIVAPNTDAGLAFRLSGPNARNLAAIELAYCHEAIGDKASAAEWMRRVDSFGEVGFHCGVFGDAWRKDFEREKARLDEAARSVR